MKQLIAGMLLSAFILAPAVLAAQPAGLPGAFSRMGFGPRGIAMGNAMNSVVDEGIYTYYNPAAAALNEGSKQFDLSTALMSFDRSLNGLSGSLYLPPAAGVSFLIINAGLDEIDGRSVSGYHTGTYSTDEFLFSGTFAIKIRGNLLAGAGFKYILADYHPEVDNAATIGLDLGMIYLLSPHFRLGLSAHDLLAAYRWNASEFYNDVLSGPVNDEFPRRFAGGLSYDINDRLLISLESSLLAESEDAKFVQVRLGSRYRLHERITVRGGWQVRDLDNPEKSRNLSGGFSLHLPFDRFTPSIDYAWVPEPNEISTMHVFGIRLDL